MTREEFIQAMLEPQSNFGYSGELDLTVWGFTPFSLTRDSEILSVSNWEVISKDLLERFPASVEVMECSHWACGWINHLMLDTRNAEAVDAAFTWHNKLQDYPIANEDDYSERELEEYSEAYVTWARWDILSYCQEEEIKEFLDEEGFFNPTEEQELFLNSWTIEQQYSSGGEGIRLRDLAKDYAKYLTDTEREAMRKAGQQALTL